MGRNFLDEFDQALLKVIGNEHPETLEKAIELIHLKFSHCNEETVMYRVLRLESEGKILFKSPVSVPSSLTEYFLSGWALWFWVVWFGSGGVSYGFCCS